MRKYEGGELNVEVQAGSLEVIPLGVGEKAEIEIRPARGVDLGVPLTRGTFKREVRGGAIGLIVDARGRPLPFSDDVERQRERAQHWLWEMGA